MPRASEVRPGKWTNLRVLFDNGVYSVVSGPMRVIRPLVNDGTGKGAVWH